jgi:hypothetical protein
MVGRKFISKTEVIFYLLTILIFEFKIRAIIEDLSYIEILKFVENFLSLIF